MGLSKKIVVSVSNDLVTDQRVERICESLSNLEYEVVLVGRELSKSKKIERSYKTKRLKLIFNNGPLFYLMLNIGIFRILIKEKPDVILSNDLDTLLAGHLYHIFNRSTTKLVYDSHEYFTEVPELVGRSARKVWLYLERRILPKVKHSYTVCDSIAGIYKKEYNIEMGVIRNLPKLAANKVKITKDLIGKKKLIYQGAINVHRGIELMVEMMQFLPDCHLYLFGDGDIKVRIDKIIVDLSLQENVTCMGKCPPDELRSYTEQCDLGFSLEEDIGLNYRYALPNKIFDYIHAGIPMLVSNLPEMSAVVNDYVVGEVIKSRMASEAANQVMSILSNEELYKKYSNNALKAKDQLNWEKEEEKLKKYF
ncbi:MAG: glycosyltransferase involved in cell wall biosynthesis [Patiriisocius sp.]